MTDLCATSEETVLWMRDDILGVKGSEDVLGLLRESGCISTNGQVGWEAKIE